ncbi:MAG: hypothetical protein DLM70_01430 [Chloroflexi bacterium]|nr:MAG: hypothetical protein DLM70_01430 [Chloroflexota bacterium]
MMIPYVGQIVRFTLLNDVEIRGRVVGPSPGGAWIILGASGDLYEQTPDSLVPIVLRRGPSNVLKDVKNATSKHLRYPAVRKAIDDLIHPAEPGDEVRFAPVRHIESPVAITSGATEYGSLPWYQRPTRISVWGSSVLTKSMDAFLTRTYALSVDSLRSRPYYFEIYMRRVHMEESYDSICRDLGISKAAARKVKERAVKKVRADMESDGVRPSVNFFFSTRERQGRSR